MTLLEDELAAVIEGPDEVHGNNLCSEDSNNEVSTISTTFLSTFCCVNGPPQITILVVLMAVSIGCTLSVFPAVTTTRYAELYYGYDGKDDCYRHSSDKEPEACDLANRRAQDSAAYAGEKSCHTIIFLSALNH